MKQEDVMDHAVNVIRQDKCCLYDLRTVVLDAITAAKPFPHFPKALKMSKLELIYLVQFLKQSSNNVFRNLLKKTDSIQTEIKGKKVGEI